MRMAELSGIILSVAATTASAAAADQASWETATADFTKVCVASLLTPRALAAALSERGMSSSDQGSFGVGWDGVAYMSGDGNRSVTISKQTYSDLKISNCAILAPKSSSRDELTELRAKLEAHPAIGKLDGKIVDAGTTVKIAMLKRRGNAPIITFNFTSTSTATTLIMNRWDVLVGRN
jgi:hypothetical protein